MTPVAELVITLSLTTSQSVQCLSGFYSVADIRSSNLELSKNLFHPNDTTKLGANVTCNRFLLGTVGNWAGKQRVLGSSPRTDQKCKVIW